jgi:hypothetical protein
MGANTSDTESQGGNGSTTEKGQDDFHERTEDDSNSSLESDEDKIDHESKTTEPKVLNRNSSFANLKRHSLPEEKKISDDDGGLDDF